MLVDKTTTTLNSTRFLSTQVSNKPPPLLNSTYYRQEFKQWFRGENHGSWGRALPGIESYGWQEAVGRPQVWGEQPVKGMFKNKVKKKVLFKLSKYLRVLFAAALLAGVLAFVLTLVGADGYVPSVTAPLVGTIGPAVLIFLVLFSVVLFAGGLYVLSNRHGEKATAKWLSVPIWARMVVVAFVAASLATESVLVTEIVWEPLSPAYPVTVFLLSFPFVAFLTLRYVRHEAESEWVQALVVGGALASLAAGGVVAYDTYYGAVPDYYATVAFLASWPVLALTLVRTFRTQADDSEPFVATVLIKSGYAQLERLESRTVAVVVGFVVGLSVGVGCWQWGIDLVYASAAALVLWPLVALAVFGHLEKKRTTLERSDLVVVAVSDREGAGTRELTIRNDGDEPISLAKAKIRDTEYDRYRLGVDVTIGVGQRCTFDIPPSFSLEPNDVGYALPLGYTLKQGAIAPVIYTRDGDAFALYKEDVDAEEMTSQEFDWYRRESGSAAGGDPAGGEPASQD